MIERVVELPGALGLPWEAAAQSVHSLRLVEKKTQSSDALRLSSLKRETVECLPDSSLVNTYLLKSRFRVSLSPCVGLTRCPARPPIHGTE